METAERLMGDAPTMRAPKDMYVGDVGVSDVGRRAVEGWHDKAYPGRRTNARSPSERTTL